jgi:hypothetical protein
MISVCQFCAARAFLFAQGSVFACAKLRDVFRPRKGFTLETSRVPGYPSGHGEVAEWSKALPC